MFKKFKVEFYTNVVYPTADNVEQDRFIRFYYAEEIEHVPVLIEIDLQENMYLKHEGTGKAVWFYRTNDITCFSVKELKEEEQK